MYDIKSRRLELGMTLEEVGDLVGVGKSTVRKWESGMIDNKQWYYPLLCFIISPYLARSITLCSKRRFRYFGRQNVGP